MKFSEHAHLPDQIKARHPHIILVTLKEAQIMLAVGSTTLYAWCRQGKLTPIKFGLRCTRFRLSEIQALIDAHTVSGGVQ